MNGEMITKRDDLFHIDNAKITYRNFRGEERGDYNAAGDRNFCLVLTPEQAAIMEAEGFRTKERPSRENEGEVEYTMPVKVNYNDENRQPLIYKIGARKTLLSAKTVGNLDYAVITHIDMTIRASHWRKGGRSGVTAYLQVMYVTTAVDPYADKYADIPEYADEEADD